MDGLYWSAGVSAACLNRFAPDGDAVAQMPLPVPGPTMPCFTPHGLFVTTLRAGRDEATLGAHPTMGGLFRLAGAGDRRAGRRCSTTLSRRPPEPHSRVPVLLTGASGALGGSSTAYLARPRLGRWC